MEIKYVKPSIELIEKSGYESTKLAWYMSKPTFNYNGLDDPRLIDDAQKVMYDDLPLTGFRHYSFKVVSSLLFRDLLFTVRPIVPWATSGRIMKAAHHGLEEGIATEDTKKHFIELCEMQEVKSLDLSKRYSPLCQATQFCISIDLRTLVSFIKTLEYVDTYLFETYGKQFLREINLSIEDYRKIKTNHLYYKLSLPEKYLNQDNNEYKELDSTYECFVNAAFSLGAQFIRQHYALVKTNLWNEVKEKSYKEVANCKSYNIFKYISLGDKEQFKILASRRTCWVAQFDANDEFMWGSIIGDFIKKLSFEQFKDNLPCHGNGKCCTVFDETKLRFYTLRNDRNAFSNNVPDENPPCPLLTSEKSMIDLRKRMYESSGPIFEKWQDLVNRIEEDPNNNNLRFYHGEDCDISSDYGIIV